MSDFRSQSRVFIYVQVNMLDCIQNLQYSAQSVGRVWERSSVERNDEWVRVERTPAFKELVRAKKAFIIPATIFFLVFYFGLPFLAAFTTVLNVKVWGPITLAYVYAFAQFAMTWILMHLYVSRANKWDDLVDQARQEAAGEAGGR
jgi:uncharacterized membrane protein (DUF485 family)